MTEANTALTSPHIDTRSRKVQAVFEDAPHYLASRQVDIRLRAETTRMFTDNLGWKRLLDIGCGDGSISLPLLKEGSSATLLDISQAMSVRARANVPRDFIPHVQVKNEDFQTACFADEQFDLIISVGVLAHVDCPDEFLAKIRSLLAPGGSLIIEFTDCYHFMGRLERVTSDLKEVIKPAQFRTNRLSCSGVEKLFSKHDLKLVSTFRYAMVPIPGFQKLINPQVLYNLVRVAFGSGRNRNAWLGNQYICLLTTEDIPQCP